MLKTVIYFLLAWVSQMPLKAQCQMDWLMKQPAFKPILKDHIFEIRGKGYSTVSAVLFKPDADSLTVYLTAYTYLTEAKDHLPSSFTIIDYQPFLIYDGSELLIEDKESWFKTVNSFIAGRLCDDLTYRELLKQPGPKVIPEPCSIIYDAPIRKVIFVKGKLRKNQVVGSVPYYLK